MKGDAGPDPNYVFGAWSDNHDPEWPPYARARAFHYAGKYMADEREVPATSDSVLAMLHRLGANHARWHADALYALALAPYADAAGAVARAVHSLACTKPRTDRSGCRCGTGPNPYGPWRGR